jgi:eukaryotic-like serine/threonine-protein kinase
MDLQPETILKHRYRIIKKLGQGGMGAVYQAHDQTLDTRVAVKTNFDPQPESVA